MPTLDINRTYNDGDILFEADLDAICDDIETILNTTKLNDDNLQDAGITGSTKLVNASVTAGKLATDSVTTSKIVDLAVTTAKLNDAAVTTAKITDANVTTAKIADSNVTTAKIADQNVTTAKIELLGVGSNQLGNSAVTTGKINNGAVTPVKISTNMQQSSSCGAYTDTSSTLQTITNLSVSITTSAKVVHIQLQPDGSGNPSYVEGNIGTTSTLYLYRDGAEIANWRLSAQVKYPASSFSFQEAPAAGTYTYTARVVSDGINVNRCILIAKEGF